MNKLSMSIPSSYCRNARKRTTTDNKLNTVMLLSILRVHNEFPIRNKATTLWHSCQIASHYIMNSLEAAASPGRIMYSAVPQKNFYHVACCVCVSHEQGWKSHQFTHSSGKLCVKLACLLMGVCYGNCIHWRWVDNGKINGTTVGSGYISINPQWNKRYCSSLEVEVSPLPDWIEPFLFIF